MISKTFGSEEKTLLRSWVIVTQISRSESMLMKSKKEATPPKRRVRSDTNISYENPGFILLFLAQN